MQPLDFDFLTHRYDFELDRKDKVTAGLSLPAAVLTALGSATAFMSRGFSYRDQTLNVFFLVFLVADVVAFFLCLYCLARAYLDHTYEYLPRLQELHTAREEWREFYSYGHHEGADEDYANEFRKNLIHAADYNAHRNDRRTDHMHKARLALLAVLVLTALSGLPYVADQVRFVMTDSKPAPQPKPTPTQPAATPQKPSFPANRVLKEGRKSDLPPKK